MVDIKWSVSGYGYETPDVSSEIVLQLLKIHEADHRPPVSVQQPTPTVNVPQFNQPFIDIDIDEQAWHSLDDDGFQTFNLEFSITEDLAHIQLFQCASEKLEDLMLKSNAKLMLKPVKDVLANMKYIAMIKVALGTRRVYVELGTRSIMRLV